MEIFRALLFFNLPEDLIFNKRVNPIKGFTFTASAQNTKQPGLSELIEEQEDDKEGNKTDMYGKIQKN